MVDAMVIVLDVTVEHGAIRAQTEFMGRAMDLEPFGGVRLVLADPVADVRVKDLGTSAGQAAQPRGEQLLEDRAHAASGEMLEPVDFHGRPGFQMQGRVGLVQDPQHVHVPSNCFW